ncbi:MAG TPA: class I SAM-dependent methyltransferase, partial [Desulfobacteria bacterium]|nr:class I SAM-dependent methyltransferase [Desulfobacteria bacterium]
MFYSFELEQFLEQAVPERDDLMREMETQALQETIPVVTPAVGNFLALLVQMSQPRNLLEIGTAIGYSTLWLARAAAGYGGKIVTIDLNQDRLHRAEAYFTRAGFAGQIEAIGGDARKILPNLTDTFDFVFLDAAKGEYSWKIGGYGLSAGRIPASLRPFG